MPLINEGLRNEYFFNGWNSQDKLEIEPVLLIIVLKNEKYFLLIGDDWRGLIIDLGKGFLSRYAM